jgi:hypothetical protein
MAHEPLLSQKRVKEASLSATIKKKRNTQWVFFFFVWMPNQACLSLHKHKEKRELQAFFSF